VLQVNRGETTVSEDISDTLWNAQIVMRLSGIQMSWNGPSRCVLKQIVTK
jgi:hypothetical protein